MNANSLRTLIGCAAFSVAITSCAPELCPPSDPTLDADVHVIAGDIWVPSDAVDERLTDLKMESFSRIGSIESNEVGRCRSLTGNITFDNDILEYSDAIAASVPAFDGLQTIDGDIAWLDVNFRLGLDAFPNVESVSGEIRTINAANPIGGFDSLETVGSLALNGELLGFESLRVVQETAVISFFNDVTFPTLETIGNFVLRGGGSFAAPQLERVEDSLTVIAMGSPSTGFIPRAVGSNLSIRESELVDLGSVIPEFVGGAVVIADNPQLPSAVALDWAERIGTIEGEGETAAEFGPIFVCNNADNDGNCPGESSAP